jgi:hypothetical protein
VSITLAKWWVTPVTPVHTIDPVRICLVYACVIKTEKGNRKAIFHIYNLINNYFKIKRRFNMKKSLAIILSLVLALGIIVGIGVSAYAAESNTITLPEFSFPNVTYKNLSDYGLPIEEFKTLFPETIEMKV